MSVFDAVETITVDGREFAVSFEPDDYNEIPWDSEDGHGTVSKWTTRSKEPGERVLCSDRSSHRYYDFAGAVKLARRDGWDTAPFGQGTAGSRAARAAAADFERLRRFCAGDWWYGVVGVAPIDDDENIDTSRVDYLGGVESDGSHWREVAIEMAREIIASDEREVSEAAFALTLGIPTVGTR